MADVATNFFQINIRRYKLTKTKIGGKNYLNV